MTKYETYSKHWGTGGYTQEEAEDKKRKVDEALGVDSKIEPDPRGGYMVVVYR